VTMLTQIGDKAKVSTLIKQKLHNGEMSEVLLPVGGFGETSSPATIAFA
jgi:hypothetical protein